MSKRLIIVLVLAVATILVAFGLYAPATVEQGGANNPPAADPRRGSVDELHDLEGTTPSEAPPATD